MQATSCWEPAAGLSRNKMKLNQSLHGKTISHSVRRYNKRQVSEAISLWLLKTSKRNHDQQWDWAHSSPSADICKVPCYLEHLHFQVKVLSGGKFHWSHLEKTNPQLFFSQLCFYRKDMVTKREGSGAKEKREKNKVLLFSRSPFLGREYEADVLQRTVKYKCLPIICLQLRTYLMSVAAYLLKRCTHCKDLQRQSLSWSTFSMSVGCLITMLPLRKQTDE